MSLFTKVCLKPVTRAASVSLICLSLCQCAGGPSYETVGQTIGLAAGIYGGGQLASGSGEKIGRLVGGIVGGMVGQDIGAYLETQAESRNQPQFADAVVVQIPESIHYTSRDIVPDAILSHGLAESKGAQRCQEFTQSFFVEGKPQTAFGVACQNPNGDWVVQGA